MYLRSSEGAPFGCPGTERVPSAFLRAHQKIQRTLLRSAGSFRGGEHMSARPAPWYSTRHRSAREVTSGSQPDQDCPRIRGNDARRTEVKFWGTRQLPFKRTRVGINPSPRPILGQALEVGRGGANKVRPSACRPPRRGWGSAGAARPPLHGHCGRV
jgi:hypothetical protein